MSGTLEAVKRLATAGNVRISEHGYDELVEDHIAARDIMGGIGRRGRGRGLPRVPKGSRGAGVTIRPFK